MITFAWKCEGKREIEKSEVRVNSAIAKHILYIIIKEGTLSSQISILVNYRPDGVRFSTLGNELFLENFKSGLTTIINSQNNVYSLCYVSVRSRLDF